MVRFDTVADDDVADDTLYVRFFVASFMSTVVIVVKNINVCCDRENSDLWKPNKRSLSDPVMKRGLGEQEVEGGGRRVRATKCVSCHDYTYL